MSDKDNGGAAFPKAGLDPWGAAKSLNTGMTMRDYFAAKALGGMCADPSTSGTKAEDLVNECYLLADAMLKERAK